MIMLTFNIKTVAIGVVVCAGIGAVGMKYVDWRIEQLKHRNFVDNRTNHDWDYNTQSGIFTAPVDGIFTSPVDSIPAQPTKRKLWVLK